VLEVLMLIATMAPRTSLAQRVADIPLTARARPVLFAIAVWCWCRLPGCAGWICAPLTAPGWTSRRQWYWSLSGQTLGVGGAIRRRERRLALRPADVLARARCAALQGRSRLIHPYLRRAGVAERAAQLRGPRRLL